MFTKLPDEIKSSTVKFLDSRDYTVFSSLNKATRKLCASDNLTRFVFATNNTKGLPPNVKSKFFHHYIKTKKSASNIKLEWCQQTTLVKTISVYNDKLFADYLGNSPHLTEQGVLAIAMSPALIERIPLSVLRVPNAENINIVDLSTYHSSLSRFLQLAISNKLAALRLVTNPSFFQKALSLEADTPLFVLGYHQKVVAEYLLKHLDKLPAAIKQAHNFIYIASTHRDLCAMVLTDSNGYFKTHLTPQQLNDLAAYKQMQETLDVCSGQPSAPKRLRLR